MIGSSAPLPGRDPAAWRPKRRLRRGTRCRGPVCWSPVWSLLASWQRWHTHGRVLVGEATTGVISHRIVGLSALSPWLPLPHVLQRSGMYLLIGRRWCEVEKCLDVPTHGTLTSRPADRAHNIGGYRVLSSVQQPVDTSLPSHVLHLTLSPSTLHRVVTSGHRREMPVSYTDNDTQDVDRPQSQSSCISCK